MASGSVFYQIDDTEQFAGTSFTSYIERVGIDLGDPARFKLVTKLYPRLTGTGAVTIKVGSQETRNGSVTWSSFSFDPSTDEYISPLVNGKFIAVRGESSSNIPWSLFSFTMDYELGEYF